MPSSDSFGEFFRANRKALGLTLREFCRRNGFDPGNISRLERGLAPPPQSRPLLESYAKALKLESGSAAWDSFIARAAAEVGRIPADVLENQQATRKLPRIFRQLRGQGHRGWIRAMDLEAWADSLDARATIPQFIRRLIRATGKDLRADRVSRTRTGTASRLGWHRRSRRGGRFCAGGHQWLGNGS